MAQEQDVLSLEYRKARISEILGEENKARKANAFKKYQIYNSNLDGYLNEVLQREYSKQKAGEMRKISSINLSERIVDEMASIYKSAPDRHFSELKDKQEEQVTDLYRDGKANVKLKKSNRFFKLFSQCAIQVVPKKGVITLKVYGPHQYDVIPREDEPEEAYAYVINTLDREDIGFRFANQDGIDQKIADSDDYKKRAKMRFVWWTDLYNFATDGNGEIILDGLTLDELGEPDLSNPIEKLPFIDVAEDKDGEFWVTKNSTIIDFALDFGVLLSDTATSNRNQGFSQAILYSQEVPESLIMGSQRVLHLKLNKNDEKDPKFEFATPSPDLQGSLQLLENYISYWLTTQGIDPRTISGKAEGKAYSSGLERLLAMIEKFEASKDDLDVFHGVEDEVFELIRLWNNAYQGTDYLKEKYRLKGEIPDTAFVDVKFKEPEIIQTKAEKEDSLIKLKKEGLKDDVEVVMELEGVDEEKAVEILVERQVRQARLKKLVNEKLISEGLTDEPEPQEDEEGESEEAESAEEPEAQENPKEESEESA